MGELWRTSPLLEWKVSMVITFSCCSLPAIFFLYSSFGLFSWLLAASFTVKKFHASGHEIHFLTSKKFTQYRNSFFYYYLLTTLTTILFRFLFFCLEYSCLPSSKIASSHVRLYLTYLIVIFLFIYCGNILIKYVRNIVSERFNHNILLNT